MKSLGGGVIFGLGSTKERARKYVNFSMPTLQENYRTTMSSGVWGHESAFLVLLMAEIGGELRGVVKEALKEAKSDSFQRRRTARRRAIFAIPKVEDVDIGSEKCISRVPPEVANL
jgi:hypothetical protein